MIDLLWLAPLAVTAVAVTALVVLASRTAEEAPRLRAALRSAAALRPALFEARAGAQAFRESLEWFRHT